MFLTSKIAVIILLMNDILCRTGFLREHITHYSESWIILISDEKVNAKDVAQKEGFEIVEQLSFYTRLYHIRHPKHPRRSKFENRKLTDILLKHPQILWSKQVSYARRELKTVKCPGMFIYGKAQYENALNDKLWHDQWYLQECRRSSIFPLYDLNVFPVWYLYKIFGRNIKIVFVDDGVETFHPDLRDNYDENLGLNLVEGGIVPHPKHLFFEPADHGTKCAGIVSMRAGNGICGAGIAPLATFGAVRLIGSSPGTDQTYAIALCFRVNEIDIMSNSWGADDDGRTMESLGELERLAIKTGIYRGRKGKGIIYLFPAGNGKKNHDTCGYDPYVSSIYTIAVGAVDYNGWPTWYSERCASIMTVVYAGDHKSKQNFNIVTTDIKNKCTTKFSGTSAAVPVAAGIVTLLLEAKNDLTWRGVQHSIAYTAEIASLAENPMWHRNKAGFIVSHTFGFGILDALRLVEFAITMEPLPPMNSCVLRVKLNDKKEFNRLTVLRVHLMTNACQSLPSEINYIEHVQLMVSVRYPKRGAIKINLHSPAMTLSHMLESRKGDRSKAGLTKFMVDSIQMWGESPRGTWAVSFMDITGKESYAGSVESLTLIIHGTKEMPLHYKHRRTYYRYTIKVPVKKL